MSFLVLLDIIYCVTSNIYKLVADHIFFPFQKKKDPSAGKKVGYIYLMFRV